VVTIYTKPIGSSFQGICVENVNDATVANLTAVGNNVKWYSVPKLGTPIPLNTILTDNTLYYASQTNPDTGCETSRLMVYVNVGLVPVPTGNAVQDFCNDPLNPPTVNDLVASGSKNWYISMYSMNPLDLNTPLVDGQNYFGANIDPPCESKTRLEVTALLHAPNNAGISSVKKHVNLIY